MNLENSLKWFYDKLGKVTYSMTYRNGPYSYDCSSAVYYALIQGGFFPAAMRIGNTDSLFGDLERNGWQKISPNAQGNYDTRKGDVFIWGVRGASGGGAGHTGMFTDANNIIHCSFGYNGIHVDNYDWLRSINGYPVQTFYRYVGSTPSPNPDPVDQDVNIGSVIKFDGIFTVADVQLIGGIWQVRSNELCPKGFTWDDNGVPTEPLYEVDNDGYATPDQNLNPGSKFVLPGKFTVLDVGAYQDRWLALINWGVYKFWIDLEPATEIGANDAGKAVPGPRPATQNPPVTSTPETETPTVPETEPEKPEEPTTPPPVEPENPKPEEPKKEDKPMAFTQEQQQKLEIASKRVQEANGDFEPVISEKVKTIAYFSTDIGTYVSVFVLTVGAILNLLDGNTAIYLASAVSALMIGIKVTFRLSSKKQ